MFEVLRQSGLLRKLLPELERRYRRTFAGSVAARFALLTWPLEEAQVNALCERLRAPNEVRELALTACRSRNKLRELDAGRAARSVQDGRRVPPSGALRRAAARSRSVADAGIDKARIERALRAAAAVNGGAIAAKASSPDQIPRLLDEARTKAIARG